MVKFPIVFQRFWVSLALGLASVLVAACAAASAYSGSSPDNIAIPPSATATASPTFTATATEPSPTPSATATQPPSVTPSDTPTETDTASPVPTDTPAGPSATPSRTGTSTRTPSKTPSPRPSQTDTRTATATHTSTSTRTPTFTATETYTPSSTPTPSNTPTPTPSPTRPPSATPDDRLTPRPTFTPYGPPSIATGDASKLKKPPFDVKVTPHFLFVRPVPNSAPSSQFRFGMTYNGLLAPHHGEDSAPGMGIQVGAAGPGTVYWAGDDLTTVFGVHTNYYGQLVVLQMSDSWQGHTIYTLYGHLNTIAVSVGQVVNTGDLLGTTGDMGVAFGPHLHFEVRLDDPLGFFTAVRNPSLWYKPIPGAGALAGRVINAAGRFIPGVRVFINCKDALRFVDTYWDQGTPPDDWLMENFAMSDIPQGVCNVSALINGKSYVTSVYIPPGDLAFVVIQTDDK